jgi:hypothetical protein
MYNTVLIKYNIYYTVDTIYADIKSCIHAESEQADTADINV